MNVNVYRKCVYNSANAQPIKANGICKFLNYYMEKTGLTDKTAYVTNIGNVFMGNVYVNRP